jgi:carboxymethylenebutenolidase
MGKLNDSLILQDINSCCEYLNTREYIKRNIHGVVGFGMGGTLAIRFASQRKRLRAAVSYYGRIPESDSAVKDLYCPVLYHRGEKDTWVSQQDIERFSVSAQEQQKRVEIRTYPGAGHAFSNETRPDSYHAEASAEAWNATASFLKTCFQGI